MGQVETISLALTPELARAVREVVKTGEYASASEVVCEALNEWRLQRDERAEAARASRALWEEALRSSPTQDAMRVFERLRNRITDAAAGP